jgi:hypothetical protein
VGRTSDCAAKDERLYSINEISRTFRITAGRALRVFEHEPGVLQVKKPEVRRPGFNIRRAELVQERVPFSVVVSVLSRFRNLDDAYSASLALHRSQHRHVVTASQTMGSPAGSHDFPTSLPATSSSSPAPASAGALQQHPTKPLYSFNEIAAMFNITPVEAALLFRGEPDVLAVLHDDSGPARAHCNDPKYCMPRVPLSVLQRVFARFPRGDGKVEKVENVENQREA